jgi:hypothetical protein
MLFQKSLCVVENKRYQGGFMKLSTLVKTLGSLGTAFSLFLPSTTLALSNVGASHDSSNIYFYYNYISSSKFLRVYIDTDQKASSGFAVRGIGADYLIENENLYKYSGRNGAWGFTRVASSKMSKNASGLKVRFSIARSSMGSPAGLNFIANDDNLLYSSLITHSVSAAPAPEPAPAPAPAPQPAPAPAATFTKPTLVNPVSPLQYGARCDGTSDDSAAFQSALRASDVLVPAGKTCVINNVVQVSMSNRHMECGAGTVLKQTVSVGRMFNYVANAGSRLTGNSIVNCTFIGSNTVAPKADWNDSGKHYNIPVQTQERVDNFFLAGNTFERFWGQSMFQTYGPIDGGSGDQIIYNTFKSCGYYGPVFTGHKNGLIAHNTLVDCAAGVENDDTKQFTGGNVIEYNQLSCVYGYGGADMGACAMLTGGATANGADYRSNIVRYNTIQGSSNGAGFQPAHGSRLIGGSDWGALASQYITNTCNNGCFYTK